jgi:hypothetical protein
MFAPIFNLAAFWSFAGCLPFACSLHRANCARRNCAAATPQAHHDLGLGPPSRFAEPHATLRMIPPTTDAQELCHRLLIHPLQPPTHTIVFIRVAFVKRAAGWIDPTESTSPWGQVVSANGIRSNDYAKPAFAGWVSQSPKGDFASLLMRFLTARTSSRSIGLRKFSKTFQSRL